MHVSIYIRSVVMKKKERKIPIFPKLNVRDIYREACQGDNAKNWWTSEYDEKL